jgi:hypothetical protein
MAAGYDRVKLHERFQVLPRFDETSGVLESTFNLTARTQSMRLEN